MFLTEVSVLLHCKEPKHPPETLIGSFSLQMFLLWSTDGRVANTCWGISSDGPRSALSLSTSTFQMSGCSFIPLFPDSLSRSIRGENVVYLGSSVFLRDVSGLWMDATGSMTEMKLFPERRLDSDKCAERSESRNDKRG